MKTIHSYLVMTFVAIIMVSCSQSEDLLPIEENVETRANSPLLIASPTEVYFEDVAIYDDVRDTINIKTAGLTSLAVLTNFQLTIQGPDQSRFIAINPGLSLISLLQALLGGGVDIPVIFIPNRGGAFEAELVITASLLGVLMPVQITIPLHGTAQEVAPLKLLYTVPEDGGTVEWDGKVPDVAGTIDKGQYHIDFVFDQNIIIKDYASILLEGITTAQIRSRTVINGNTLRLIIWEDATTLQNTIIIEADAIISADGTELEKGNERIKLTYQATGEIPDNEIE